MTIGRPLLPVQGGQTWGAAAAEAAPPFSAPLTYEACAAAGMTIREAALALGKPYKTVSNYAIYHGLKFRSHAQNRADAAMDAPRDAWPDWWLAPQDSLAPARCLTVWQAVLNIGLRDALEAVANGDVRNRDVAWVGGRDFHMVCALAGVEGAWLAERLAPLLRDRAQARRVLREAVTRRSVA